MLEEIIKERQKKLDTLKKAGIDPYPSKVSRSLAVASALSEFEARSESKERVSLAGRLRSLRDQGKIVFADLEDETGRIQVVLKEDILKDLEFWKSVLDTGDFISVTGTLFLTKRGEKSVATEKVEIASKTLLPLPDQWYGLEDIEARLRERYVDLIVHPEVREMFVKKGMFWASVREFLQKEGFLEVETSVLEPMAGGAEAEPFRTHHNALDTDFYLRISLELQLKKLVVGGFERVFEIGRVFRNEGIDRDHLQDFTFMECYWAYHDYRDMMRLTERLYKFVIERTMGTLTVASHGHEVDWSKPWPEIDYIEAFKKENGFDPLQKSRDELFAKAKELGLAPDRSAEKGRLIDLIYKKTVRPKLINPCFLVNTPLILSPLSKASRERPEIAERFQILAFGTELGNGYSEINDSIDQRHRFEEQMKLREKGDAEAMPLDDDFLRALACGMPPTTGFGMSERVFSILMDKPIRETVFFPLMRKENSEHGSREISQKTDDTSGKNNSNKNK